MSTTKYHLLSMDIVDEILTYLYVNREEILAMMTVVEENEGRFNPFMISGRNSIKHVMCDEIELKLNDRINQSFMEFMMELPRKKAELILRSACREYGPF